ncbi:EexN family lipoprotein [Pseudoxanthomonas suwonensis]|uniref:Lipoprotein n=1 Tax=Pseudoxanthomonas suwonensis TaxID=314722 RepID=A0A0E3UMS3_9GAMM|nr:EexN family lipoprotein [Pseudoxanthomonas suwonensis]AKC86320.1 hypothetical protein WQ53_05550 [Pseudoxanthomonas suwonensis]
MRQHYGLWLGLFLVGCQPSAPADTVESLTADLERLKVVQRQCRLDRASLGDAVCDAASEAYRRRFMGDRAGDGKQK